MVNFNRPIFNNPNKQQRQAFKSARSLGKTPGKRYNELMKDPTANAARLSKMSNRFGFKPYTAPAPVAPTPTTPAPTPASSGYPMTPAPAGNSSKMLEALFPQTRGIEPTDYQGSELYKFQTGKAEDALKRYYASKGLTDSKAEAQGISDAYIQIGAQDSDKMRSIAQQEADRAQGGAGRLLNYLQYEGSRGDQNAQNQFQNQMSIYQMLLGQNPMEYAYGATGDSAKYNADLGNQLYASLAESYKPAGGGGGGGGFQAPFPSGPDMSGIDMLGAIMGGSNNSQSGAAWGDIAGGIMSGLSGWFS